MKASILDRHMERKHAEIHAKVKTKQQEQALPSVNPFQLALAARGACKYSIFLLL